jgi:hypothetical protein
MAPGGQLLKQYLGLINQAIAANNGAQLWSLLPIEPPFSDDYQNLLNDVFSTYSDAGALKDAIRNGVSAVAKDDKDAWAAFPEFLQTYFNFIRTVNPADLLSTYEKLSNLINKAHGALKNDPYGILILPTVLEYAKVLARLAIGLDKQPHLIAHLQVADEEQSASLPEQAAMIFRPIIGTCARDIRPNGKGSAVYKLANLCMKILFQCNKPEGVPTFYNAVVMHNRPLNSYPRSERVTYLYYLGRYFFVSSQFYFALVTLEAAYAECHTRSLKQRRLILVYLVAASIILGRFPSPQLYARPEATGFEERFKPITDSIRQGNLSSFLHQTSLDAPQANWFLYFGILYQIKYRCEPLVWRSLARRTFAIRNTASNGPNIGTTSEGKQKAATLDLADLLAVGRAQIARAQSPLLRADTGGPGNRHTNYLFLDRAADADPSTAVAGTAYVDPDFDGLPVSETEPDDGLPDMDDVECTVAGLCLLGLLNGFVSHKLRKFAVQGAKQKPALVAGWPGVWETLVTKHSGENVPGWKRKEGVGGGMVISMVGAAPAGS